MFIYRRHKAIVAKLIALQTWHVSLHVLKCWPRIKMNQVNFVGVVRTCMKLADRRTEPTSLLSFYFTLIVQRTSIFIGRSEGQSQSRMTTGSQSVNQSVSQAVRQSISLSVSRSVCLSDLALSIQLRFLAIFLLYNRKFWFCMSWGTLPDGWTGLSRKRSQYLYVNLYTFIVTVLLLLFYFFFFF
jgi:hypothetical protein